MTNESVDPLIGRTVAHYEILARLGGGGMGVVYRARDTRLGRVVALKFLPPQWSHDEDAKQRFIREAQAASATEHRNICTIHDVGTTDDGQLFIVMAYYEGQTLKQRLASGALAVDEALDIATQVADGLARAHGQGVVHRDIKPGNLILAEDGVRIVDFGLATFADALQLTIVGSTLGTAAYMSPEQVRGETADARTDVWATGVILYQMLTGHVPFRGAYAEAIAYAIRNDAPPPLATARPEVAEDVEQLVFRALHKDPVVRFQSGRELARALRQVRGQTVPMDLRTEPVAAPLDVARGQRRPRRIPRPLLIGAAAVLLALLGTAGWMLRPVERIPIVIVPVADLTGFTELQPYRRALTQSMVQALTTSATVRPISWPRTLQTLRGFIAKGADISSREVESALTRATGVQIAILPTLMFEDRAWRVRVEVRDARTSTNIADYTSDPVVSALRQETAYRLIGTAVDLVEAHFRERGPRGWLARRRPSTRLATLDAARVFEAGLNWHDEQEYPSAYRSFVEAATLDSSTPLAPAWASRAARLMRRDGEAVEFADRAVRLLTGRTPVSARLFVEAVAAEATRQQAAAEARLRDLIREYPDEVSGVVELAAFQDRHASTRMEWQAAVATYHDSLMRDAGLVRPHLELCRLYASLQELQRAKDHGQRALAAYRAAGWLGGEALARFCLVDVLRAGGQDDQRQAQDHAQAAMATLTAIGFSYNVPRALSYLGLAAAPQGKLNEAVAYWEQASTAAESSGNVVLQPSLLTNLGVAHQQLGHGSRAADFYHRSAKLYEGLGEERRAARQQYNSAVLRVSYGVDPDGAARDLENTLAVVRKQGDVDFEVACLEIMAVYYRHAGRHAEAEQTLNRALSLAKQHALAQKVRSVTLEIARLRFEKGEYGGARALLLGELGAISGRSVARLQILLGRVHTRLGDVAAAQSNFDAAFTDLESRNDSGLRLALDEAIGELAYESDQPDRARPHFVKAISGVEDAFVEPAAVEARAYIGLLDARRGRVSAGRAMVEVSLDRAKRMQRVALETRCRLLLAQIHLLEQAPDLALRALEDVPGTGRDLGLELRAQVHYWRSRAIMNARDAAAERALARKSLEQLGGLVPKSHVDAFSSRPIVRMMFG